MINEIKELRGLTGVGIAECKKALDETSGNVQDAIVFLRKQGTINAGARSAKKATEGTIGFYMHTGGKICAIVEINCETDFVARSQEFQEFAHEVAMHIAATHPMWLVRDDVPQSAIDQEMDIIKAKVNPNKPKEILEKIINGKLDKFFKDTCLMEQMFIKDTNLSIEEKFSELKNKIKENLIIKRFERFEIGS